MPAATKQGCIFPRIVVFLVREMGRTYQFDCPHCQYHARISGGVDEGIHCVVQTMVCLDCRELFDALTQVRRLPEVPRTAPRQNNFAAERTVPPPLLRDSATAKLKFPPKPEIPARPLHWEHPKPACPVDGKHRVQSWNSPGRCPRCGCYLERNGFPFRRWE